MAATAFDLVGPEHRVRRRLPPGQREITGFPRFGKDLRTPPPPVPEHPSIEVTGVLRAPVTLDLADLRALPQVERVEDFHCVAGWTATDLRWSGVRFADVYRAHLADRLDPTVPVSHLVFRGLDGYEAIVEVADALVDDVLIATGLDGEPLSPSHGAPMRLVSPRQYGFVNIKHLCAIEVHQRRPRRQKPFGVIIREHARARVWQEERHEWFPPGVSRPLYRMILRLLIRMSARAARRPTSAPERHRH